VLKKTFSPGAALGEVLRPLGYFGFAIALVYSVFFKKNYYTGLGGRPW